MAERHWAERVRLTGAVVLAILGTGGAANAASAPFLALGALTEAPRGFTEMCANKAEVCDRFARAAPGARPSPSAAPLPTLGLAGMVAPSPVWAARPQQVGDFAQPFAAYKPPVGAISLDQPGILVHFAQPAPAPDCAEAPRHLFAMSLSCLVAQPLPADAPVSDGTAALASPDAALSAEPPATAAPASDERALLARIPHCLMSPNPHPNSSRAANIIR